MSFFKLTFLLIIFDLSLCGNLANRPAIKPIKALSVELDEEKLMSELLKNRMIINKKLDITSQVLQNCKAIGSISSIDLRGNKNLQFYFTYKLHASNSTLQINIFARMLGNTKISKGLLIVMDFLIAQFPSDYGIFTNNITSYQTHVLYNTTRQYQLIFFLNGFNNFSLSGNITHSYQDGDQVYTIHYMSCQTQSNSMGWREDQDYLLYTLMVVPVPNVVQKFRLADKHFSLDYPQGYQYFYGIKGSIEEQFWGSFSPRLGGVIFKAENLNKNKVYGLVFMPYPGSSTFSDQRSYQPIPVGNIAMFCLLIALVLVVALILYKKLYCVRRLLNHETNYNFEVSEGTKSDLKQTDLSRHKYEINTVVEVQEKYESTTKNSYQPEVHQEPSLVLKQ